MKHCNLEKVDSLMKQLIEDNVAPGISIAVVTENEKWMNCYGNRQLIPEVEANTIDTIWDLASISKVLVTTTCILKLIEEGLISLDTTIKSIIPELQNETLTIKECITHTSGFPADVVGYKTMSKEEVYEKVYTMDKEAELVNKVNYSDVNFIILGLVIARLKGSLDAYAREVMFEPLQMFNTYYCPGPELKSRCAAYEEIEARGGVVRGVVHDGKAYKLGGVSGHAGAFSTLEDITHFVEMLLNDGVYHGERFFEESTIELLKTCQTPDKNEFRSIGWILSDKNYPLGDYFSEHTIYHTGFSGPSILVDLEKKLGCIVLCNRVHPSRDNKKILTARKDIHNVVYSLID